MAQSQNEKLISDDNIPSSVTLNVGIETLGLGLRFGSSKCMLARQVEEFAYSFLQLEDLANVWITSRGMAASVARYLKHVKSMQFHVHHLHAHTSETQLLGLELAIRYCRSLTHFVGVNLSHYWLALGAKQTMDKWVASMITLNRATLRSAWFGAPQTNRILRAWSCCTLIESISLSVVELLNGMPTIGSKDPDIGDDVVDRLTVENMPHLRSLSMNLSNKEQIKRVLSQGFVWTNLNLRSVTLPMIDCLCADHFRSVQKLSLQLNADHEIECVNMLTQLGKALMFMSDLTYLDFCIVRSMWMHFGGREVDPTRLDNVTRPIWHLPSLRKFELGADFLPMLPDIRAPLLEDVSATEHAPIYTDFVSMLLSCPQLTSIDSCPSRGDERGKAKADERLLDALRCGVWPRLKSLDVDTAPGLLNVLAKVPTPIESLQYRSTPGHSVSTPELVAVIHMQPQLAQLDVLPNFRNIYTSASSSSILSADAQVPPVLISIPHCGMRSLRFCNDSNNLTPLFRAFSFPVLEELSLVSENVVDSFAALLTSCPNLQELRLGGEIKDWDWGEDGDVNVSHPLRTLEIAHLQQAIWQHPAPLITLLTRLPQRQALTFRPRGRGQKHTDSDDDVPRLGNCVPEDLIQQLVLCGKSGHLKQLRDLWLFETRLDECVYRALLEALPQVKDLLFLNGRLKNGEFTKSPGWPVS